MRKYLSLLMLLCLCYQTLPAQKKIDQLIPTRGLAIKAPRKPHLTRFIQFIEQELVPAHFNKLILRVDYNYEYKSHPELRDNNPLTYEDVKSLLAICKKNGIELIPQINLLGHQSWEYHTFNLLKVYPQFDETPHVKMDEARKEKHSWPNEDGLYCKSYCPLHPEVHKVVFALVDEIMDAFEASYFHAGLDEVFYIGDDKCPRCSGLDKAELFAGEVNKIRNHLAQKGWRLMMWGDRLIDGKTTGIGEWEASMNNTHRAIDRIEKDVVICDWHYNRAEPTAPLFAMKGFDVLSCPWNKYQVAEKQIEAMITIPENSNKIAAERYKGILQTIWSPAETFLDAYYDTKNVPGEVSDVSCIKEVIKRFKELNK